MSESEVSMGEYEVSMGGSEVSMGEYEVSMGGSEVSMGESRISMCEFKEYHFIRKERFKLWTLQETE
jgi:RNA-splicing ligase RtcB